MIPQNLDLQQIFADQINDHFEGLYVRSRGSNPHSLRLSQELAYNATEIVSKSLSVSLYYKYFFYNRRVVGILSLFRYF